MAFCRAIRMSVWWRRLGRPRSVVWLAPPTGWPVERTHQPKKGQPRQGHCLRASVADTGRGKGVKARPPKGRRRLAPTSSRRSRYLPVSERVQRRSRLLRSADFDRTLRAGRRAASEYLALFVSDNELGRPRVGLAVSKKLGNAVVRNRIKRRLRELVR